MNATSFMHIFKRNRTSAKYVCYGLYLYYFLGLSLEIPQKLYLHLLKEVMFLYGSGFKTTNQKEYLSKEKNIRIYS
jgi:hypothetical protein